MSKPSKICAERNGVAAALLSSAWRGGISGLLCWMFTSPTCLGKMEQLSKRCEGPRGVPLPGEPPFWRQLYTLELVKCFRAAAYFAFWTASGCRWFPKHFVVDSVPQDALRVLCPHCSRAALEARQSLWGDAGSVFRPAAAVGKKGQALRTHRPVFRVISVCSPQSFFLLKYSENTSSKGLI